MKKIFLIILCVIICFGIVTIDLAETEGLAAGTVGNDVYLNADFETQVPMSLQHKSNVIKQYVEDDGNTAMIFNRTNSSDFHMDAYDIASQSDYVVYEFKIKAKNTTSQMFVRLVNANKNIAEIASLDGTTLTMMGGKVTKSLTVNKWHHIVAVFNYYDGNYSIYFDGTKLSYKGGFLNLKTEYTYEIPSGFGQPDILRFHVKTGTSATEPVIDVLIDDCCVYDSTEPLNPPPAFERVVNTNTGNSVFEANNLYEELLNGYISIHSRSGVVYSNGFKRVLNTIPSLSNGIYYVSAEELDSVTGLNSGLNGQVSINSYASTVGMVVSIDDSTDINGTMIVLGNSDFTFPTDGDVLKSLNDFAFYERPTMTTLISTYNASSLKGIHPRLHASNADFDRIKRERNSNYMVSRWANKVIEKADSLLSTKAVIYELRDGVRLLEVCRDVLENMYTLGMAYQLTGEQKYVDRAYKDLYAVCHDFPDWHPSHNIDVGEMAVAVAIGYDWMYHGFTDEQRNIIEQGIYNNGFYHISLSYQKTTSIIGDCAVNPSNHNTIINSGAIHLALAAFDKYPAESAYILENAIRSHEYFLPQFAPEGLWFEGPSYWELTTQYLTKTIASLQKVFGTDYSLSKAQGLSQTAMYPIYMQSPNGVYSYGDCETLYSIYTPEMLWMSEEYNNPDVSGIVINETDGIFKTGEDYALAMIWYDTSKDNLNVNIPKDRFYESNDVFTARESWTDKYGAFVGIHAGRTNESHSQIDGGSFIYDWGGVRWAEDLGLGNYNAAGNIYWDSGVDGAKWDMFMSRAESHNTIVVNPSEEADHDVSDTSYAEMEVVENKAKGVKAVVDMTNLLHDVTAAARGFMFTDNRKSLVVRDELTLEKESDVYWFMMTKADAVVDGNTIVLSKDGKSIKVEFLTNASSSSVSFGKAAPLDSSPHVENDKIPDCNRLAIKLTGSGNINITVKITPYDLKNASNIVNYDKSIANWTVDDGEIPDNTVSKNIIVDLQSVNLVSSDKLHVMFKDNCVAVLSSKSHPINAGYLKNVISSQGYRITYTDSSKVECGDDVQVYNGYLKLTSKLTGTSLYVPVLSHFNMKENYTFESMYDGNATAAPNVTYSETVASVGNKDNTDTSCVFTADNATSGFARLQSSQFKSHITDIDYVPSFTFEFSVYADGDAVARVNYGSSTQSEQQAVFMWYADGSYAFNYTPDGTMNNSSLKTYGTMERGKWHNIVISYDADRCRYYYYVDGEYVDNMGRYISPANMVSQNQYFLFGIDANETNGSGMVAYDDLEAYFGGYYIDENAPIDIGLSSSNSRVIINEDNTISVFSNPVFTSYNISYATLVSSLTNSGGYNLSYVNANKQAATPSSVTDGYIKAVKEGYDTYYFPIKSTGDILDNNFGEGKTPFNISLTSVFGVGGKAPNDESKAFVVGNTPLTAWAGIGYMQSYGVHTYEFNIYADGNTSVQIAQKNGTNSATKIFIWNSDGSFTTYKDASPVQSNTGTLSRNEWHNMIITYDAPRGRYLIFIDGELVDNASGGAWGTTDKGLYIALDKNSANGKLVIDNFICYEGYCADFASAGRMCDDITFTESNGSVLAKSTRYYGNPTKNILVIASYSGNTLIDCDIKESYVDEEISVQIPYNQNNVTKAFFWTVDMVPFNTAVYNK